MSWRPAFDDQTCQLYSVLINQQEDQSMSTKPLSPTEVWRYRRATAPDFVVQAWNDCIARSWDGLQAVVYHWDIVVAILEAVKAIGSILLEEDLYCNGYLDLESMYREAGWEVSEEREDTNYHPTKTYVVFRPAQKA